MLTAHDVQEVARTGRPYRGNGFTLTVGDLVAVTRQADWDGTLFQLKFPVASELAAQLNTRWYTSEIAPNRAERRKRARRGRVLTGEVVG